MDKDITQTRLQTLKDEHLLTMMTWFSSSAEILDWAGPNFEYPFTLDSFRKDLKLEKFHSYTLLSDRGELLAFGQYYRRLDKCHLARLVVAPSYRGKKVVTLLVNQLSQLGLEQLGLKACSLFVYRNHRAAISAYEKQGFRVLEYPEEMPMENCLYMVK